MTWCSGCKTDPCAYPIMWVDFRCITYRWFAPQYYGQGWARNILSRYSESEKQLGSLPVRPTDLWLVKSRVLVDVFNSMRVIGMVNPLVVKSMSFHGISEYRDLFQRYDERVDFCCVIGNQRLCVLRVFWEYGWLKSSMVGCRIALPEDPSTDRCTPIFKHPYRQVQRVVESGWVF